MVVGRRWLNIYFYHVQGGQQNVSVISVTALTPQMYFDIVTTTTTTAVYKGVDDIMHLSIKVMTYRGKKMPTQSLASTLSVTPICLTRLFTSVHEFYVRFCLIFNVNRSIYKYCEKF